MRKTSFLWKENGHLTQEAKDYLSKKLKKYYQSIQRVRKQIVYNSSYNVSLRAISFNPKHKEDDLDNAIIEFLNSNPILYHIPFDNEGFEEEVVDSYEDKYLSQTLITIEYNQRGHTTYTEI